MGIPLIHHQPINIIITFTSTNLHWCRNRKANLLYNFFKETNSTVMTTTDREDPAAFSYFETHNFEGWIRQFRNLAESTGDSALAFDPISSVPVDDDGDPIPLNGAAQRDLQTRITRWRAADEALKGLLARACRKNPTTKSMYISRTWDTAADFNNALIARYRLQSQTCLTLTLLTTPRITC